MCWRSVCHGEKRKPVPGKRGVSYVNAFLLPHPAICDRKGGISPRAVFSSIALNLPQIHADAGTLAEATNGLKLDLAYGGDG